MCNAYNHAFDCPCGFGGDTGGGGWRGGRAHFYPIYTEPLSSGWAKDSSGTVESYVNPNAHCPVCGETVYFYRSPYNGRVFFDELGWPWPKHPCTDNSAQPRRATRNSVLGNTPRAEPAWRAEGWSPLLSVKVYSAQQGRSQITGDFEDEFLDLYLPSDEKIDHTSPVLIRGQANKPYIFEVSFLRSDAFGTRHKTTIAFSKRIATLSDETIRDAHRNDPVACNAVGQFLLELDDPFGARPYLERAVDGGIIDSLYDLAVLALLPSPQLHPQ
jgi:hypothetical protein